MPSLSIMIGQLSSAGLSSTKRSFKSEPGKKGCGRRLLKSGAREPATVKGREAGSALWPALLLTVNCVASITGTVAVPVRAVAAAASDARTSKLASTGGGNGRGSYTGTVPHHWEPDSLRNHSRPPPSRRENKRPLPILTWSSSVMSMKAGTLMAAALPASLPASSTPLNRKDRGRSLTSRYYTPFPLPGHGSPCWFRVRMLPLQSRSRTLMGSQLEAPWLPFSHKKRMRGSAYSFQASWLLGGKDRGLI